MGFKMDDIRATVLVFLDVTVILWICKRMSLFLRDTYLSA